MKIAIILPSLIKRAPVIVARDIVNHLVDKVDEIVVFYFDQILEVNFNCKCKQISFWKAIDFDYFDIIHSHMLRPDLYVFIHKSACRNAKFISTLHQDINKTLTASYNSSVAFFVKLLWYKALREFDVIATLTFSMKTYYGNVFDDKKLNVVYNGRDLDAEYHIDNIDVIFFNQISNEYNLIGSIANLTKVKGLEQLIYALQFLDDFAIVIVGDGKEKKHLMKLAENLCVNDRCFFLGHKSDAFRYLSYFDVFAMPSYSEGFGLSLLEAGLYKLPIVCSDIPVFRELYTEHEVNFFELDNINSLVSQIKKAYDNRSEMSFRIYNKVKENYSVEAMISNYFNLYSKVLRN